MILDNKKALLLVALCHAGLIYAIAQAPRPATEAKPIFMQAVPLAMGEPMPEPAEPAKKPLAQVKQKIKQVKMAVKEKIAQPRRPLIAAAQAEATPDRSSTMEVAAAEKTALPAETVAAAVTSKPSIDAGAGAQGQSSEKVESVSAPSFHANYLSNPKPPYPPQSLALGEQGVVLLRVAVNAAGLPERIDLHKSSGFVRLDKVAQSTVQRWKFVPAKRGDDPVAGAVIVPVNFSIKKS